MPQDSEHVPSHPSSRLELSIGLRWLWTLMIFTMLLTIGTLVLYAAPGLMVRWWHAQAGAAADAAYLRRQAELKAESEAADTHLHALDNRLQLVSLGFREVAQKVAPAVVNIRNEVEAPSDRQPRISEGQKAFMEQAEGSGILVRPGYVLTNHHVVRKAQQLRITFPSGAAVVAKADDVLSDELTDLAVIRLAAESGREAARYEVLTQFADSDKDVHVGDWALAVGSPFGLKQTVTAGIVSAKGRMELGILDFVELLQTDAAINPGNSGGPLFDQFGRVIGINVAIASKTGGNQGVGFAIPSNTVREIFDQLVEHGEVVRGFLGIMMQELPGDLERRLSISDTGGVVITRVEARTPAYAAGLKSGDIILRYDGTPVGNNATATGQLRQRIARTKPETPIAIDVLRGRRRFTVEATIGKREPVPY